MSNSYVCLVCDLKILMLLLTANGAPVLAYDLFKDKASAPVDCSIKLKDGQPLFGSAKTWRGILASIVMTTFISYLLGYDPFVGFAFGFLAMMGDLLASFIKRRLGHDVSSQARGLDTGPETLAPILILKNHLLVNYLDIFLIVGLFFVLEEWLSPILYKLHIRKRPF